MLTPDPGSFRDPASHVVHDEDRVLRLLDERGLKAWEKLEGSRFFHQAVSDGRLIETTDVSAEYPDVPAALSHPRLPLITYPYEWTFRMMKDAALLQLDLLAGALAEGLTVKDATPFNIQFTKGRPLFIDIGSFEAYQPGEPWIGYRQFTRQFLFPLMLRAWVGIPHGVWLRGDIEGPTAADMKKILPRSKRMKPAAMLHVTLQARMEARMSGESVRDDLKAAGFSADLIMANVRKLRSLVEDLDWDPEIEGWSDYTSCTHVGRDRDNKSEFLRDALDRTRPTVTADLGANDGHFSSIAEETGALAVAIDADEPVLDDLYQRSDGRDISIVVSDLTNPSPSQGWAGRERPALFDRVNPDLIIAYGVIHHLVYTASIPPTRVLDWLRHFECPVVLEYVSPADPMVARLTANKRTEELHQGTGEDDFRLLLQERFKIMRERRLEGGSRVLFDLDPATD